MSKKKGSIHMGNEFNHFGDKIYIRGKEHGFHAPYSQENVRPTPDFTSFTIKVLGSIPIALDPLSINKLSQLILGSQPSINCVLVYKEADGYKITFRAASRGVTAGAYLQNYKKEVIQFENVGEKNGWYKMPLGWRYREAGEDVVKWKKIDELWYYFNDAGYMETGWHWEEASNKWYYLDPVKGYMKKGWVLDGDKWYYLRVNDGNGNIIKNGTHYMLTGWRNIDGETYYLVTRKDEKNIERAGYMAVGWRTINEEQYYFNEKGHLQRNKWINDDTGRWWVDENGVWDPDKKEDENYYDINYELDKDEEFFVAVVAAESVGEGELGWKVVANVIMNRVGQREWEDLKTPKAVMQQKDQFSCLKNGGSNQYKLAVNYLKNRKDDNNKYEQLISVVMPIYHGEVTDITNGAQLYYSPKSMVPPGSKPYWADKYKRIYVNGINSSDFVLYTGERID